jgi:hypothetical protein
MAQGGNVTLSGPILEDEVAGLLSCVKWIPGVKEVNNNLEVHEEAGNHPALQGGRERQGHQFEFFQENWAPAVRWSQVSSARHLHCTAADDEML